ncbi:MAG: restriction endonuclease [Byssovorax sp.]
MYIEPTVDEARELLQALYDSFPTGAEFEAFLKVLLNRMGLEDVAVTKYSRDGGIDLTARRPGLEELSRVDEIKYIVQAKRLAPNRAVSIEGVRAFRGVMGPNEKGLFITTGRFTSDTEKFVDQDLTRPIILIDGHKLVGQCIDHELGFRFRPIFARDYLLAALGQLPDAKPSKSTALSKSDDRRFVKTVTANDIRARIISLPWEFDELLQPDVEVVEVAFPPHTTFKPYQYRRDRRYIAGVTDVLRAFGLLTPDGERHPRMAEWIFDSKTHQITVRFGSHESFVAK